MLLLALIVIAYLIGSIPTGLVLASYYSEVDIQQGGSGNIGASNVYRLTGRRLGVLTLLGDALKGASMALLATFLLTSPFKIGAVAFAAYIGHCFSAYLDFKGGKGVATAAGIYLVLTPLAGLLSVVGWVVVFLRFKRSSLGALVAAALLPILILAFPSYRPHIWLTGLIVAVLVYRHRENLERLMAGSEPKTSHFPAESGSEV